MKIKAVSQGVWFSRQRRDSGHHALWQRSNL